MPDPSPDRTEIITPHSLRSWRLPEAGGNKRSRGQVVVCGGDRSAPGAVMLAGLAALRVGAGVLRMALAESLAVAVAVAVPEAAVTALPGLDDPSAGLAELESATRGCDALLVGPGLDDADHAEAMLEQLAGSLPDGCAVVLDAFALGVLPGSDLRQRLGHDVVLTPNSSEAARLLDVDSDELDDEEDVTVAARIAQRYDAVVTYSGAVADPSGRSWLVPAGHSGLGTSGSGDVLAGAIVGLLARGADPAQATCWATYLHASAGDRLAPRVGRLGFLARELVEELPQVLVQTEA